MENLTFTEKVNIKLTELDRGNRWLIGKLKDEKQIVLTDTQLSNRRKDIHPYRDEEIKAISELLGIE